jgi:hypothetical protein
MSKARDLASAAPAPAGVTSTELGYVDGVTSAIQTQLDAKTAKSTLTTTGDIYYASAANTPARLGIGSTSDVLTVVAGVPGWAAVSGGYSNYQSFTSSGTWTVPTGITKCAVYMVGGGGGGGSGALRISSGGINGGGGGAGGAIASDGFYTVTPAANITVTVGAGGAGGAAVASISSSPSGLVGSAGTNSAFDGNTAAGGVGMNAFNDGGVNTSQQPTGGLIFGRIGVNGQNAGNSAVLYTGVRNLLNVAGSLGNNGAAATAGTILGTAGVAATTGFVGSGGAGQSVINSTTIGTGNEAAGTGSGGGGAGGAAAVSATNITTTAGAGGAGAANRGGGGGGGGAAEKVGTTTTTITSGAGGNGGSGIVVIFY